VLFLLFMIPVTFFELRVSVSGAPALSPFQSVSRNLIFSIFDFP